MQACSGTAELMTMGTCLSDALFIETEEECESEGESEGEGEEQWWEEGQGEEDGAEGQEAPEAATEMAAAEPEARGEEEAEPETRVAYLKRVVVAWEKKYMAEHNQEKPTKLTYCPKMLKLRLEYLALRGRVENMP